MRRNNIKKVALSILLTFMVVLVCQTRMMAATQVYQDFKYQYNEQTKGIEIKRYVGKKANVKIPSEIEGISVNSIGDYAFQNNTVMETVIIPDTIKYMGNGVFMHDNALNKVVYSNNLIVIPEGTFNWCRNLEAMENVEQVKEIGMGAFEGCLKLKKVNLCSMPKLTKIGWQAFKDCSNLREVIIPSSVTEIGQDAFLYDISLQKISIQKGKNSLVIGAYAFGGCSKLTKIQIPANVTMIKAKAFYKCKSLKSIRFKGSAPKIQNNAFAKISTKAVFYVPGQHKTIYTKLLKKSKWYKTSMKIKKL